MDDSRGFQLTYNYYDADQNARYKDVPGNIDLGEKTYAIPLPEGEAPVGAPQGPNGNYNVMLKYQDASLFSNTALTIDAYRQKIDNVFFWSDTLGNPDEGYNGGQSAILSEKKGLRTVLTTDTRIAGIYTTFIYGLDLLEDVTSQPLLDGRIWGPEMDMGSKALFLQSKWELGNDWTLKAGARREDISVTVDDYDTLKVCRDAQTCSNSMEVTGGDLTLIENEASVVKNYELGFSGDINELYYTVAVFRSTSELGNRNTYDPDTGIYRPVRAPQKIWGFEATAEYQLAQDWHISSAYGYTEGKDKTTDTYLGARQISAPKLTTAIRYTALPNLNLTLNWLHVFDRKRFEPNEDGFYTGDQGPISHYDRVDLSVRYHVNHWEVFGGVQNVLNADYFPARAQALRYGTGYSVKAPGATLNAGVTYRF